MFGGHQGGVAVSLATGKVLLGGGLDQTCPNGSTGSCSGWGNSSAEQFDPGAGGGVGGFSIVGNMPPSTGGMFASLLASGRVLVAPGDGTSWWTADAVVYDPATGNAPPTGSMAIARGHATATTLRNGKVLVAGGWDNYTVPGAELFDPASGTFSPTKNLITPRESATAVLLLDGRVLIAGGRVAGGYSRRAEIYEPPGEPLPSFTTSLNPVAPAQSVTFDASGSSHTDPARSIVSYLWDFGDGATASGSFVSHAYSRFGTYTVTLTLQDDNLPPETRAATTVITVNQGNRAPVAAFLPGGAISTDTGRDIAFDGSSSSDPDAAAGDSIISYAWDFGDGTTATAIAPSHAYSTPGTYTVQLTVTDTFGAVGSALRSVTVVSPVVAIGGAVTAVGADRVHTFSTSGTLSILRSGSIQVLVVAGGGGGGQLRAGGGGGGGVVFAGAIAVNAGDVLPVTIGAGGVQEKNGANSSFGTIVAIGGGAGRGGAPGGAIGGSGGGGGACYPGGAGTQGQGNAGGAGVCAGSSGGGGGGAGGPGSASVVSRGGAGGPGFLSSITGTARYFGGGGGGGSNGTAGQGGLGGGGAGGVGTPGVAGQANSGGGGGGGGSTSPAARVGGTGGSGVVIVRYTPTDFSP